MHRVDEQGGRRIRSGLATMLVAAFATLALALPAFASADFSLTIKIDPEGAGTVECEVEGGGVEACKAAYPEGTELTLVPEADTDSEFIEWEGDCKDEPEECELTMDGPRSVTAVFELEPIEYPLEIEEDGAGWGEVACMSEGEPWPCDYEYPAGTHVQLVAVAEEGSKFVGWSGDCEGTKGCQLTMDGPRSVTATFDLREYKLTVRKSGTGEGTIECEAEEGPEPCGDEEKFYPWETYVTILATPAPGSEFVGFSGACEGTSKCEVEMTEVQTVTVTFAEEPPNEYYTLTVKREGTGSGSVTSEPVGIDCGADCAEEFFEGTEVALTATPSPGSVFKRWFGPGCAEEKVCKTKMGADKTYKAIFIVGQPTLTVAKAGSGSGTVTSSPAGINCGATCNAKFEEGTEVTLTAGAAGGSEFTGWAGCDSEPAANKCVVTMDEAHGVTATFDLVSPTVYYTLTVVREGSGSGTVTSEPAGIDCGADCAEEFPEGAKVALIATPAAGAVFKRWTGVSGSCASEEACWTTMGNGKTVKAVFDGAESKSSSPPEAMGRIKVIKRVALVRGNRALLKLRCVGGPCKGRVKLIAGIRKGKRRRSVVIGKRSFGLASGAGGTLKVKLSKPARRELGARRKLKAKVKGSGIVSSTIKLKTAKRRKKR